MRWRWIPLSIWRRPEFAELVKDRTNGAIEIKVFPNSGLGTGQQALNLLRGGTIERLQSGSTTFNGLVGETAALEMPFLFRDADHAHHVLDGKVGQSLLDKLGPFGVQGLAFLEQRLAPGDQQPASGSVGRGHQGPKDPHYAQPLSHPGLSAVRCEPRAAGLRGTPSALETGAVDAQEHPLPILWAGKFYEVQNIYVTSHAYPALFLVMNKPKFDSLPVNYQTILIEVLGAPCGQLST